MVSYCIVCGCETEGGGLCCVCAPTPKTKKTLAPIRSIEYVYNGTEYVTNINLDNED